MKSVVGICGAGLSAGLLVGCLVELDPDCFVPCWNHEIVDVPCTINGQDAFVIDDDLDTTLRSRLCTGLPLHAEFVAVVEQGADPAAFPAYMEEELGMRTRLLNDCRLRADATNCDENSDECVQAVAALELPFREGTENVQSEACAGGGIPATESQGTGDGGDGQDVTSGSGYLETGSESGYEYEDDPFGDIEGLTKCFYGKLICVVDPELLQNVFFNFQVFLDDAVLFVPREHFGHVVGLEIFGLDDGEASTDLAEALGFRDGDVLTRVNGMRLRDLEEIEAVVDAILEANIVFVRLRRNGWPRIRILLRGPEHE